MSLCAITVSQAFPGWVAVHVRDSCIIIGFNCFRPRGTTNDNVCKAAAVSKLHAQNTLESQSYKPMGIFLWCALCVHCAVSQANVVGASGAVYAMLGAWTADLTQNWYTLTSLPDVYVRSVAAMQLYSVHSVVCVLELSGGRAANCAHTLPRCLVYRDTYNKTYRWPKAIGIVLLTALDLGNQIFKRYSSGKRMWQITVAHGCPKVKPV